MNISKHISLIGLLVACILYQESLRPVLLPLNLNSQIIFSGIVIALGYDLGLIAVWLLSKFKFKKIKLSAKNRNVCLLLLIVFFPLISKFSLDTQQNFRTLLTISTPAPNWLFTSAGSLTLALLLLQIGHKIRSFAKYIAQALKKPFPAVYTVICILVAMLGYFALFVSFFFLQTSLDVSARPDIPNLTPPKSTLSSGSSNSLISWQGLGQKGQEFISIKSDLKDNIVDPIRIYAGVNNQLNLEQRIDLIMKEFERTKAYERSTIILYTPSGSGWVQPIAVKTFEKLTKGNSASISLQYSNKQAVLQYLLDPKAAGRSSTLLFTKLRERLDKIESAKRPKLYVYGESLGSLGSQEIFQNSTIDEITNAIDGIIWVGSPSTGPLWRQLALKTFSKEDDGWVKVTNKSGNLQTSENKQIHPKILFLYNDTDPIVWSSNEIIYKYPNWLKKPRSTQIKNDAHWLPLLTFGHLYFELYSATKYPSGIGHNYEKEIPCAVAYIMQIKSENICI